MNPILEIKDIHMYFGGIHAVNGVSAAINPNEIFGIIGPNGSGKTTLINVLTGIHSPNSGSVVFNGKDITGEKPYTIASLGIARTFQNLRLFGAMSVRDNILVGEHTKINTGISDALFRTRRFRESEKKLREKADELLELVGLKDMADELAGSMAYGQQKCLEFARALSSDPLLCILDEPVAGMTAGEAVQIMKLIQRVRRERGITFIIIEHNMEVIMNTADRIMVMDTGQKIAEDVPKAIQQNELVIKVYLGEEE